MNSILNDKTLCGHALTSLPQQLWEFSQGELCYYGGPKGARVVEADYFLFQRVHYRTEKSWTFRTEMCIEKPLFDLIEWIVRRVLGSCAATFSLLLVPIGFTAKLLHAGFRKITQSSVAKDIDRKLDQIWNDATLCGHALTSAPENLVKWAKAPLHWHLRPDGTDRRAYIVTYGPDAHVIHQPEYQFVPFEVFEVAYRSLGAAALLIAGPLSAIGLAVKTVHFAGRNL